MQPKKTEKDLMEEALAAMNAALSNDKVTVLYGWPQKWTSLPIVTYSLAGLTDKDKDLSKLVVGYGLTYNIDIWCASPTQCLDLLMKIDKALLGLGYTCVSQGTIYEDEARHHLRATASAYYDVVQNQLR